MTFLMENFYMESDNTFRDLNIICENANLAMMKINHMYEMMRGQYEINIRQAELKVVKESGTSEDLIAFYEEAENEASSKNKGIIQRAIDAIKKFFKNISDFIKEKILKIKVDKNATCKVKQSVIDDYNTIVNDVKPKIDQGVVELKAKRYKNLKKIALGIAAALGLILVGVTFSKSKKNKSNSNDEVKELPAQKVNQMIEEVEQVVDQTSKKLPENIVTDSEIGSDEVENVQVLTNVLNEAGNIASKEVVQGLTTALKNQTTEQSSSNDDKSSENGDEENYDNLSKEERRKKIREDSEREMKENLTKLKYNKSLGQIIFNDKHVGAMNHLIGLDERVDKSADICDKKFNEFLNALGSNVNDPKVKRHLKNSCVRGYKELIHILTFESIQANDKYSAYNKSVHSDDNRYDIYHDSETLIENLEDNLTDQYNVSGDLTIYENFIRQLRDCANKLKDIPDLDDRLNYLKNFTKTLES